MQVKRVRSRCGLREDESVTTCKLRGCGAKKGKRGRKNRGRIYDWGGGGGGGGVWRGWGTGRTEKEEKMRSDGGTAGKTGRL